MTAVDDERAESSPGDQWAIVELMGHVTIIGRVTERAFAGAPMLRIERPDGRVQRVSPQSLYRVTDCTEAEALAAHAEMSRWGGTGLPGSLPRPAIGAPGDPFACDPDEGEPTAEDAASLDDLEPGR